MVGADVDKVRGLWKVGNRVQVQRKAPIPIHYFRGGASVYKRETAAPNTWIRVTKVHRSLVAMSSRCFQELNTMEAFLLTVVGDLWIIIQLYDWPKPVIFSKSSFRLIFSFVKLLFCRSFSLLLVLLLYLLHYIFMPKLLLYFRQGRTSRLATVSFYL